MLSTGLPASYAGSAFFVGTAADVMGFCAGADDPVIGFCWGLYKGRAGLSYGTLLTGAKYASNCSSHVLCSCWCFSYIIRATASDTSGVIQIQPVRSHEILHKGAEIDICCGLTVGSVAT